MCAPPSTEPHADTVLHSPSVGELSKSFSVHRLDEKLFQTHIYKQAHAANMISKRTLGKQETTATPFLVETQIRTDSGGALDHRAALNEQQTNLECVCVRTNGECAFVLNTLSTESFRTFSSKSPTRAWSIYARRKVATRSRRIPAKRFAFRLL